MCEDNHNDCGYWAGIGECQINPGYMLQNCKKSCNQCGKLLSQYAQSTRYSGFCVAFDAFILCSQFAIIILSRLGNGSK